MPKKDTRIKVLRIEEANALIPVVCESLKTLRRLRDDILKNQAKVEIEELTGTDDEGRLAPHAQSALTGLMETLQQQSRQFERELKKLSLKGAQLKDLDSGLVDFYSLRGAEVVFLCWKEGESEVRHWHSLEGGFKNRRPLV